MGVIGVPVVPPGHGASLADVDPAIITHIDDALLGSTVAIVALLDLAIHLGPASVAGKIADRPHHHRD